MTSKCHLRLLLLVAVSSVLIVSCVTKHWRLFRLDSLKPDAKGNYDLGQMWYGTVDRVDGWDMQLSVVALIAAWQNENMRTDTFGVTVRMWRVDSLSTSSFRVDTLSITTLPDSSRFALECTGNRIHPLYPHFRYINFHPVRIPKSIDTVLADFRLVSSTGQDMHEEAHVFHCRLVRFDTTFQAFAAFAD